jgi:hypothetical protein
MSTKSSVIVVVILLAAIVAYRLYTRSKARQQANVTLPDDPNLFMPDIAAHAVEVAAGQGKTLDYSPESVKVVEAILAELHDKWAKGALSDKDVNTMAIRYGAYIGEVLRRKDGGSWATDHPAGGPKSYPIHWKDHDSFPVRWCGKRILNGAEDNVWFKFQVLTSPDQFKPIVTIEPKGHPPTTPP